MSGGRDGSSAPHDGARAALLGLQRHLEAIYAVDPGPRAADFLIGDATLDALVGAGVVPESLRGADEQVLVLPEADGVSLALHLSDAVQAGLMAGASLQDHCHATEGVSHFVMIVWSAGQGRAVRLLDLELQAEVDKAATTLLLARERSAADRSSLLGRLFGGIELAPGLSRSEQERYLAAHQLGRRYSARLATLLDVGVDRLLGELRAFYRMPGAGKIERVRAA